MARRKKPNVDGVKILGILMMLLVLVAGALLGVRQTVRFFVTSEMFVVTEVVRSPGLEGVQSSYLDALIGRNIFNVDLRRLEGQIRSQYPGLDRLRIQRQLPHRIYLVAERRDPVMIVVVGRNEWLVDQRGVLVSEAGRASQGLPVVTGVPVAAEVSYGKPIRSREVAVALKILAAMAENEYLKGLRVVSMDVESLSKITVQMADRGSIVMDEYQVEGKLGQLGVLISQPGFDLKTVRYVDLRFKEPILSAK